MINQFDSWSHIDPFPNVSELSLVVKDREFKLGLPHGFHILHHMVGFGCLSYDNKVLQSLCQATAVGGIKS